MGYRLRAERLAHGLSLRELASVGRLVLTNCDSFRHFPPAAFKPLFVLGRVPGLAWALLQPMRSTFVRHLNFRPLVAGRKPGTCTFVQIQMESFHLCGQAGYQQEWAEQPASRTK